MNNGVRRVTGEAVGEQTRGDGCKTLQTMVRLLAFTLRQKLYKDFKQSDTIQLLLLKDLAHVESRLDKRETREIT